MVMPRKKRRTIIILFIIIIMIIIIGIISALCILYTNTDLFKSNTELFAKYFKQNFDNISYGLNDIVNENYNSLLKNCKYQTKTGIKINYAQNIGTTLENMQNPINQLKIETEEQKDILNNYNYKDIKLMKEKEKILEVKFVLENNLCGVQFSDMFNQYVSANNENLKELLKKTESFSDEQLSKIPNKIELNYDFYDVFKFSVEEKENISKRYTDIIINNVPNKKVSKQTNKKIQIGENSIKTNEYTISLTKEELNNIYIKLLEELKQDEIILSKIDKLQDILEQYQINFKNSTSLREKMVTEIQYLIDDIVQNNIGQEECKIIVYEQNGITIKNIIQGTNYEINVDLLELGHDIKISYKNETEEKNLTLKNESGNTNIVYQNTVGQKISKYSISINENINGNDCERIISTKYEDDVNRVEMNIEKNIQIVEDFKDKVNLNSENSVNLSELSTEEEKDIINRVNTAITEKINEIQETNISNEDIRKILIVIGFLKEEQTIVGTGVTETEKNRFNSKFEILQGEELDDEAVINLINAIKENLVELEPVSETELKLKLDRYNKNEDAFNTIINFIQNLKNKTYNAKIEYDETTGLAKDILLTMIEKKK